jgi:hypothetical protein
MLAEPELAAERTLETARIGLQDRYPEHKCAPGAYNNGVHQLRWVPSNGSRDTRFQSPTGATILDWSPQYEDVSGVELLLEPAAAGPHPLTIFTDEALDWLYTEASPRKAVWLLEPPEVNPDAYNAVASSAVRSHVGFIHTWAEELLRSDSQFVFAPYGTSWIAPEGRQLHIKSQMASIIASRHRTFEGQHLRHAVVDRYRDQLDAVLGNGYQPIEDKLEGLADFRYTVVIENVRRNYYFTEKLIDAFVTGTIPIYWGCPAIGRFFNTDGMIVCETLEDVGLALASASEADYQRRLPAITENLKIAASGYADWQNTLTRYILPWYRANGTWS